jgi:hypothetical protein
MGGRRQHGASRRLVAGGWLAAHRIGSWRQGDRGLPVCSSGIARRRDTRFSLHYSECACHCQYNYIDLPLLRNTHHALLFAGFVQGSALVDAQRRSAKITTSRNQAIVLKWSRSGSHLGIISVLLAFRNIEILYFTLSSLTASSLNLSPEPGHIVPCAYG